MPYFICETCGVQHDETDAPPDRCEICADARQYVNPAGQSWTTLEDLKAHHKNTTRQEGPDLVGIGTTPSFAIGQRALLVQAEGGNVLWDCISLLDEATVAEVGELGGLAAIATSHPHFYSSLVEWSRAFGDVPVYLHGDDREWVMRRDPCIVFWDEEDRELLPGVTLVRCGGHFAGSSVLHWEGGADGRGALLTGDTIQVLQDQGWMSFMYSYPNHIPLSAETVHAIVAAVEPYSFEAVHGGWFGRVVESDGKAAIRRSADRYVRALTESTPSARGL